MLSFLEKKLALFRISSSKEDITLYNTITDKEIKTEVFNLFKEGILVVDRIRVNNWLTDIKNSDEPAKIKYINNIGTWVHPMGIEVDITNKHNKLTLTLNFQNRNEWDSRNDTYFSIFFKPVDQLVIAELLELSELIDAKLQKELTSAYNRHMENKQKQWINQLLGTVTNE